MSSWLKRDRLFVRTVAGVEDPLTRFPVELVTKIGIPAEAERERVPRAVRTTGRGARHRIEPSSSRFGAASTPHLWTPSLLHRTRSAVGTIDVDELGVSDFSRLRGWRSDRRAALIEIVVGICVGTVGAIEFVLSAGELFALGALHWMPALVLIAAALLCPRRDPFTRPVVAALLALVLGSAHINAVMGLFGAPLALVGAVAIVVSLRPNRVWALLAAVSAGWTLEEGVVKLDGALRLGLLSGERGHGFVLDAAKFRLPAALSILGVALVVLSLALRRSSPAWSVRMRVGVVALLCFPVGAVAYWILALCGLPLDA